MTIRSRLIVTLCAAALALSALPAAAGADTWSAPFPLDRFGSSQVDNAIACPSSTQCTAASLGGQVVTFNPQNPGVPTAILIDANYGFGYLACPSATQCTGIDNAGKTLTFDPTSPAPAVSTIEHVAEVYAGGLSCPSTTQCTAVDGSGAQGTFNPQTSGPAARTTIDPGGALTGVSCPTVTQCTAVDATGHKVTFNPQNPGTPTPVLISGPGARVTTIVCPSASLCVASNEDYLPDFSGTNSFLVFDPAVTSVVTPTVVPGFSGYPHWMSCPSTTQCTALSFFGGFFTFNPQNPVTTTIVTAAIGPAAAPSTQFGFEPIACPSTSQCTATDLHGQQVTFNPAGEANNPVPTMILAGRDLYDVDCPTSTQCTAVDNAGQQLTFNPDSPALPDEVTVDPKHLEITSIDCPSAHRCVAPFGGKRATFDPTSTVSPTPVLIDSAHQFSVPTDLDCPTTAQCTAVYPIGLEVTFNPGASGYMNSVVIDPGVELASVSCPTDTQCTAIDLSGRALTFNPTSPGLPTPTPIFVAPHRATIDTNIQCPTVDQCTAAGALGYVVTFEPANPSNMRTGTISGVDVFLGLSCPAVSQCTALTAWDGSVTFDPLDPSGTMQPVAGSSIARNLSCPTTSRCVTVDRLGQMFTGDISPLAGGGGLIPLPVPVPVPVPVPIPVPVPVPIPVPVPVPPPDQTGLTLAQLRALRAGLQRALVPRGPGARISRFLRRGYAVSLAVPAAGQLTVRWFLSPAAGRVAARREPVLAATGTASVKKPGTITVTVKASKAGKRLLGHARRARLAADATFSLPKAAPTKVTGAFTLKR